MEFVSIIFIVVLLSCTPIIFYLIVQNVQKVTHWKKRNVVYYPPVALLSKDIFKSFLIQHSFLAKIYEYGSGELCCGFFQFRKPVLMLRNPQVINLILNQEFKYFQNKRLSEYSDGNQDPLSQHLLALNGFKWRCLRARLSPTFTSEKLKKMFFLLKFCVGNFINEINKSIEQQVDVIELCGKLSIDSIASCAFGLELNCLRNENNDFIRMGRSAFRAGTWEMFKAHLRTLYPAPFKMFKIKAYGKDVNDFFCSLVTKTIERRKLLNEKRGDFINLLMQMLEEDETSIKGQESTSIIKFTKELIAAQAFSFFIGGYETTSVTMSCIFYEVARNDKVKKKLQTEVDTHLSTDREISYDDLKSLEYLDLVIKEVLRLHPPAFYIQRICSEDFIIPGTNIKIEKNMELFIPILQIHHDEKYFSDPSQFIPERFSHENKHKILKGSYLPFGDGPRKCIGMRFSLMELKLALARTLMEYDFYLEADSPKQIVLEDYSRIYKVKNKILIKFSKRLKTNYS